jgi:serpin B
MSKKNLFFVGLLLLFAVGFVACSNDSTEDVANEQPKQTGEFADIPLTSQQKKQVPALNDFALHLTQQMALENKSFVVSPLSVAFLLGMLDEGAEGETQAEIARTLGLGNASREEVNELMAALLGYTGTADNQVTVAYANNVTLNAKYNYQLTETFGNAMKKYYDASIMSYDFSKPEALLAINGWSNEHSKGLIPSIIDELDENAVMCLLNAVYFKGCWVNPFDKSNTCGAPFKKGDGLWTEIKMMKAETQASYYDGEGFKALNLPIGDGTFSMTLLLPAERKRVYGMLEELEGKDLQQMSFEEHKVKMTIPIFKTTAETDLIPLLSRMGIKKVFNDVESQLIRIVKDSQIPLFVGLMKQKAQLGINEEGTEGSAVTFAEIYATSDHSEQPQPEYIFNANRPFVYFISDKGSGAILFMGMFAGE